MANIDTWQSECRELRMRLSKMLSLGLWTDCELAAGAAAERVPAHRVLLASASPVLATMIYGSMQAPPDHPLLLPDVEPEIANLLVMYIYTDHVLLSSCDVACSLYRAAHYLLIPHLAEECKTYLVNNVSPESVLKIYEFAQLFDENALMKKCLKVMAKKTSLVLERVGTTSEIPRAETLAQLFAMPELHVNSELELLQAAERWARQQLAGGSRRPKTETRRPAEDVQKQAEDVQKQAKDVQKQAEDVQKQAEDVQKQAEDVQKQAEDVQKQAEDVQKQKGDVQKHVDDVQKQGDEELKQAEDLLKQAEDVLKQADDAPLQTGDARTLLRPVLQQIRFLAMHPDDFAQHDMTHLLSHSDLLAISLNFLSIKSHLAMPTGFTTCREPRKSKVVIMKISLPIQKDSRLFHHSSTNNIQVHEDLHWSLDINDDSIIVNCCLNCTTNWYCNAIISIKVGHPNRTCSCTALINKTKCNFGKGPGKINYRRFTLHELCWDKLKDPENGYIVDGAVNLEIHIEAQPPVYTLRR